MLREQSPRGTNLLSRVINLFPVIFYPIYIILNHAFLHYPVADFGAQALVIGAVHKAFPEDFIVGEEDAKVLRAETDKRDSVWDLVRSAIEESSDLSDRIGIIEDTEEMLALIDRGSHEGGSVGSSYLVFI